MAEWQSGYAAACKAVYAGSIPTSASITSNSCPDGEIGRRKGLKIPRWKHRAGSTPAPGTIHRFRHLGQNFNLELDFVSHPALF